jgi:holo-[acyl-carrier protein] synthase
VDQLYTGIDIVEISRIEQAVARYGERFLARVFTAAERERYGGSPASLAARWAAKEAAAKMLGVGLRGLGAGGDSIALTAIEVLAGAGGGPEMRLYDAALARAEALGIVTVAVSLSHSRLYAVASVTALGRAATPDGSKVK